MPNRSVITISLRDNPAPWGQLFADSPDASVFTSTLWLTHLAEAFDREPLCLVLGTAERPLAGIPMLQQRRGPLRVCPPLPVTMYAGILRARGVATDLSSLLPTLERRLHFASLSAVWSPQEREALVTRRWRLRAQQTYRLDIRDMHAVWEGYSQSLRRKLRRIPDAGFLLEDEPSTSMILRMFEQSYTRHRIRPPIPGNLLDRWLSALRRDGTAMCFAALHPDGRPAAVRVVLRDGPRLFDWLAGSDPTVAPSASHWLVHTLLGRFSALGCERFDFMGANTPGISDFKRSFGGSLFAYHEADWYRPAFLRHLNALRNRRERRRREL